MMACDLGSSSAEFPQQSSSGEEFEDSQDACVICKKSFEDRTDKVILGEKGVLKINSISEQLGENVHAEAGDAVHSSCRRVYTNKNYVASKSKGRKQELSPRKKRPREASKDSGLKCLFCGHEEKAAKKGGNKNTGKLTIVRTMKFQESVLEHCLKRNDRWSREVRAKVEYMQDLIARDAVYHSVCYTNFRTGLQIPKVFTTEEPSSKKTCFGRPENQRCAQAFQYVIEYLQTTDTEQFTVPDLVKVMESQLTEEDTAYTTQYLKKKLKDHFGDDILIAEKKGTADVVTLKTTASSILREFHKQPKSSNPETEKLRLLKTAASLLVSDIKSLSCSKDKYPEIQKEEQLSFLPDTLRIFLTHLFKGKDVALKVAAIGQAMIQVVRPNTVLAPLQIGLGVQMHKVFGSRFLLDTLNHLGFCSSYTEVRKFEMNAAAQQRLDLPSAAENQTIQFVADNVDHNLVTIDGHNTFHGMGIIAVTTPGVTQPRNIPRKNITLKDIKTTAGIGIYFYRSEWKSLATVSYKELPEISSEDPTGYLETLWKISWPLKSPRPAWKGMMQVVHNGDHPGKSEVFFLPIIDINPGDLSCIYSTLRFVASQATKCKMTPVLTFDQPLYLKAQSIVCSEKAGRELKSIVLRLGCFHMQMSFLGSIGNLMAGSGLQEALELVFASSTVIHMLDGKAYDRAVRGHLLVDATLNALLTADAFDLPWILIHHEAREEQEGAQEQYMAVADGSINDQDEEVTAVLLQPMEATDEPIADSPAVEGKDEDGTCYTICEAVASTGDDDLDAAAAFMERIIQGDIPSEEEMKEPLLKIMKKLEAHRESLSKSRTSKLWFQYLDMIDILRMSIKAERTGNFDLHLQSVQEMLPYFAASGHNNYLRSGRLYLQQMLELPETHPEVYYQRFQSGHHSIRRTDRHWAGLSYDLVIEQVLMRSLKTNGGLTRGRGMSESERLVWLLSMPACAHINASMQLVTGVSFSTSEQHKDSSETRQNRDHHDTRKLLRHFQKNNPFKGDVQLKSLSSGRIADTSVNVDSAKQLGLSILDSMTNSTVADIKFKRKDQAVTLAAKSFAVTTQGETINVDPTLLFQRLVHLAEKNPESLASAFQYELTNIPTSLFEPSGLPREAKKHTLADFLWTHSKQEGIAMDLSQQMYYVLDGGSLLHRLSWGKGMTYNQVIQSCTEFLNRNYPEAAVIFDGYNHPSTKDVTHMRRKIGHAVVNDIDFDGDMLISETRENFLSNETNKQRFIDKLITAFRKEGIETHLAKGDADCLIVSTTLEKAKERATVLIGQDTDLLVLLLFHTKSDSHKVFLDTGKRVWDIQSAQKILGPEICENILFGHAVGGCDTTSSLFSIGKSAPVLLLKESLPFRQLANTFAKSSLSDEVVKAGEEALVLLYGGRQDDSLDKLRHIKYVQKLSTYTSALEPKRLPPTSSAAQFHSLRTFLQVQEWKTLGDTEQALNPRDWGWEIGQDNCMFPIYTNAAAAPEDLLNIVKCNCKTDCSSAKCSCRRHGLVCTMGCGDCRGENCTNRVDDF